jgi:acyl carrier protein
MIQGKKKMHKHMQRGKQLTYKMQREKTAQQVMKFTADYFGVPVEQLSEDTQLEELKRDPHELIRLMLDAEDAFQFEFPDDLRTRKGRLKACRADTIRRIGELATYIARLPGNSPK